MTTNGTESAGATW
jgi:hypothetical protein